VASVRASALARVPALGLGLVPQMLPVLVLEGSRRRERRGLPAAAEVRTVTPWVRDKNRS